MIYPKKNNSLNVITVVSAIILLDMFTASILPPNSIISTSPGYRVMAIAEWYTLGSLQSTSGNETWKLSSMCHLSRLCYNQESMTAQRALMGSCYNHVHILCTITFIALQTINYYYWWLSVILTHFHFFDNRSNNHISFSA